MSLRDLTLRKRYRSGRQDLLRDFYIPCLERSLIYNRAVGYFSSSSLALAAQGLTAFIKAGGRMRLVASPHLSEADIEAIAAGLQQRDAVIEAALTRELSQEFEGVVSDRLACLSWLLAHDRLEIKIAVVKDLQDEGIYHEKLGLFIDAEGNQIAFGGSANESARAYRRNFECITLFWSWRDGDAECIDEMSADFEDLWQNQTPELDVMEFPEAAKRKLLERCPEYPPEVDQEIEADRKAATPSGDYQTVPGVPMLPQALVLRDYQKKAIANWFKNKGRGTLKMATGSGKTITALAIASELYKKCVARNKPLQALLIVCPYRHLVTQWAEESRQFGLQPILAFNQAETWQSELQSQLLALMGGRQPFVTIITTNATLRQDSLQSQLAFLPSLTMIIGDEAHNLGAKNLADSLPDQVKLRLALSATPERYFDEAGTERIFDYFGPVLEPEFTLKDAIQAGALSQYVYHPLLVNLEPEEIERYAELTAAIGRAMGIGGREDNVALERLLFERARLICTAQNKLTTLRSLMADRLATDHTLFYCGDGSIEDETTAESQRQLEAVTDLLKYQLGYAVEPYIAETSLSARADLRYAFERGHVKGLVAIRCLDEGVDIPAIQTAVILASSSNPRQFIQRRGRILRKAPGKNRAELFDMIVVPPDLGREYWEIERRVLKGELTRFVEFADLALNAGEARKALYPLQEKYDLLDL
ncbi:DEAD/DEAH box helicase family protein [Leptolyngbya iicbica]|uniref:DEAD/DEAH box helicase n=2 Tax=Cyanophyceae TaxID=3028117 RepID=A0A4Q7E9P2_9CYAN|nr:DEAD/DEAH box helicase family protein [Leptolyngbya sp. LK]RZM79149.1 DEAD/DEAH box helicase [Leptolyngbya sp. LK]